MTPPATPAPMAALLVDEDQSEGADEADGDTNEVENDGAAAAVVALPAEGDVVCVMLLVVSVIKLDVSVVVTIVNSVDVKLVVVTVSNCVEVALASVVGGGP